MQGKTIDIEQILSSKVYIGEKSLVNFGSPRQYIEPFLEKFTKAGLKLDFKVSVSERVANRESESETVNEAYGRVAIVAQLPVEFTKHNHNSNIGLVYALDTAKPTIRVYSGEEAWACTNLAIFGAKYVHEVPIMSGIESAYEKTFEYIEGLNEQLAKFQLIYEKMNDIQYNQEDINRTIGRLLRATNKNKAIGTTPIMSMVQDLDNPKSRYAITDGKTTQWNMYSAITDYVTNKVDIFEKATKTQLISNLFVHDNN